MSTGPDDQDGGRSFWSQWPILLGLTLTWGALWQDFSPGVLLAGVVFSMLTLSFYRLPRVNFSDRFNLWYFLVFTLRFLWHVVTASVSVAWDAISKGPTIVNSVVAVPLRSHDDLIVTLTGHSLALVPGSLVIDVDRPSSTLYLHCLNVKNAEAVEAFRAEALRTEAAIIRALGSKADLALVQDDEARRAADTAGGDRR
ncbi:Na+/H+ antiporter subunit E [Citricoccus zhacaiensis]|uniref:Na+/H+ antiporter subunit E n=1 Tax=Citricoccus zhacaiensis TaxID=489142 RepID=A0ABQ2M6U0_9MICC|nr:Na+/H+ antiporter subunit E [Citricoccus zhacaiensis]GGO47683.1 Na+/H+ antiporter subunit E [Citricoccus zhacaiensis]